MSNLKEEILSDFDEKFEIVPAISGNITESDECCNCGEDLGLELYDAFSEGYKMATNEIKQFISSSLDKQHKADMEEVIRELNKIKIDASNANKNDDYDYILTMQIGIENLINTLKENNIKDKTIPDCDNCYWKEEGNR